MLHHPFVDWAELLPVDGCLYQSYVDAFRACVRRHHHPEDFYTDPAPRSDDSGNDSGEETDDPVDPGPADHPLADFKTFAPRGPRNGIASAFFVDSLGARDLDRASDWSSHVGPCAASPDV